MTVSNEDELSLAQHASSLNLSFPTTIAIWLKHARQLVHIRRSNAYVLVYKIPIKDCMEHTH